LSLRSISTLFLSLFFLKFASDKFEECRNKIIATHGEKYADMKPFYTQENVFYLPEESRWKYIMENAKQDDIALKIDTALYTIEKEQPGTERCIAG
jgi:type I restriction enzyme M protein